MGCVEQCPCDLMLWNFSVHGRGMEHQNSPKPLLEAPKEHSQNLVFKPHCAPPAGSCAGWCLRRHFDPLPSDGSVFNMALLFAGVFLPPDLVLILILASGRISMCFVQGTPLQHTERTLKKGMKAQEGGKPPRPESLESSLSSSISAIRPEPLRSRSSPSA